MRTRTVSWAIVAIVIVSGCAYAFERAETKVAIGAPIRVGFIGPLTGDATSIGAASRAAVEMAVQNINAKGGIDGRSLDVIYEDGGCTDKMALSAADKLIHADKVSLILGGACSTETSGFAKVAMDAHVPVLSYCSSAPSLSQTGQYFFRDYPSDAYQGKFSAEYLYNMLGARRIAIIFHNNDWGQGVESVFKKRFTELGGSIVDIESTPQSARDYRTELTRVRAANPDYLYAPTYPEGGAVLLRQMHELGISLPVFGGDTWDDTKFWKDVAGLPIDIRFTKALSEPPADFTQSLLAKTGGTEVPLCAPQAYDMTFVMANALERSSTDADAFSRAMRATSYDGVSGHIAFDGNGDLISAMYATYRVAGGTATLSQ